VTAAFSPPSANRVRSSFALAATSPASSRQADATPPATTMVIDARGVGFSPCLMPEIIDPAGRTVRLLPEDGAGGPTSRVPVRYVLTALTFTQLGGSPDLCTMRAERWPVTAAAGQHPDSPAGASGSRLPTPHAASQGEATLPPAGWGSPLILSQDDADRLQRCLAANTAPTLLIVVGD
jgi:hypothetical protein